MQLLRLPTSLLALAASVLFAPQAHASSTIRNPISALSTVRNATIHTNQHRLTALSDFDLTFNLRDDLQVKLRLQPNHDILPPDASISYLAPDGSISHREEIDRGGHRVFKGVAWIQRPRTGQDGWQQAGWARVYVRRDGRTPFFEGAFAVDHDHHHIQSSRNYMRTRHWLDPVVEELRDGEEHMVIWRDSDIVPTAQLAGHADLRKRDEGGNASALEFGCLADGLSFNAWPDHPVYLGMTSPPPPTRRDFGVMDFSKLFRRQIDSTTGGNSGGVDLTSTIGNNAGCPTTRKVALVGVATDCTYAHDFNSTQSLRENVISQMNQASAVWETAFNISLGLQNLTVSDSSCPGTPSQATEWNQACSDNVNIQDRLNYFSAWRGEQGGNNSHWTLLSTCNTGSAIGLAWLGQACVGESYNANSSITGNGQTSGNSQETVVGANVVIRTPGANEWQVIAHETGHTFGAVHDCTSDTCANANVVNSQQCCPLSQNTCDANQRYIMNPAAVEGVSIFSPCTIGNICSAIGRNSVKTNCLSDNKGVATISGQQCGNGIVEPGEECDCGGTAGCGDDPCCDGATCKFKNGATCDDSNEDCCQSCQLARNGTVCRASTGPCDPAETCTGSSANCPADVTTPDGQGCGNGLQCASGQCTSRDQQCKTVMGSYAQNNDTYACDSQGCTISCASPDFGTNVCYGLQQNFLDGTECGGGGRCSNGQCKGTSTGGEIRSWIDDHKAIVIGVCVSVGALLLFIILGCLLRCCRRGRRPGRKTIPSPPASGWQGWNGPAPPAGAGYGARAPPMEQQYPGGPPQGAQSWYGGNANMSGARGGLDSSPVQSPALPPPMPPPPGYMRNGGSSVRYA